jgi:hypothetical protein
LFDFHIIIQLTTHVSYLFRFRATACDSARHQFKFRVLGLFLRLPVCSASLIAPYAIYRRRFYIDVLQRTTTRCFSAVVALYPRTFLLYFIFVISLNLTVILEIGLTDTHSITLFLPLCQALGADH